MLSAKNAWEAMEARKPPLRELADNQDDLFNFITNSLISPWNLSKDNISSVKGPDSFDVMVKGTRIFTLWHDGKFCVHKKIAFMFGPMIEILNKYRLEKES